MPFHYSRKFSFSPQTRQSLLERVKDPGNKESWVDFFGIYAPMLFHVSRRAGLSEADAEEAVQETLTAVAKAMPDFEYDRSRGTFKSWLRQILRSRIIARWRRERKHIENVDSLDDDSADNQPLIETLPDRSVKDFETIWDDQWQKDLFEAAKERVKPKVKPRQYQIFHCAIVKEWPALKIARDLKVNLGQVYFARRKVEKLLSEEVKRLERAGR